MTNNSESLSSIWEKGCREAGLSRDEAKRFAAMARSRFHTFEMGIEHASDPPDDAKTQGLINGLAAEMRDAPGLQKLWQRMAISQSDLGKRVNLQLERLQSPLH